MKKILFLILIIGIIFFGFLFFREKFGEKQEVKILSGNDLLESELGPKEREIELELIGVYETSGQAEFVFVSGNFAYLASKGIGLQVVKIFENN